MVTRLSGKDKLDLLRLHSDPRMFDLEVSGTMINFPLFFSMSSYKFYISRCEIEKNYRLAFIETIFEMYKKSKIDQKDKSHEELSLEHFTLLSDEVFISIINLIINDDKHAKEIYDASVCDDKYERFYLAYKKMIDDMMLDLKSAFGNTFKEISALTRNFQLYNTKNIKNIIRTIPKIKFEYSNSISETLNNSASMVMNMNRTIADHIQPLRDVQEQFFKSIQPLKAININLHNLLKPIHDTLSAINFEALHADNQLRECNRVLNDFGWWYITDISQSIIEEIYEKRENITKEQVDELICQFYRSERNKNLKSMLKKWNILSYYGERRVDFHEALIIHSRKYYNSSVTLLMLHIEGVIRDFVRIRLGNAYWKVGKANEHLKVTMDESNEISYIEHNIYTHILKCIDTIYSEGFDPTAPEKSSDFSRNKRGHGQALAKQSEVNSLKLFLYLNELFYIFKTIEEGLTKDAKFIG